MIRLDRSTRSIVAYCTECPSWRALHLTMLAAHAAAIAHERACHPDSRRASFAALKYASRNVHTRRDD